MRRWCAFFAFFVRHVVFLEGVYLDRTEAGLKPRFIKGEPPSDADIAEVLQKISRRVIRIGSGFGYEGERPALTGPRCASVSGFSLHANTQVPAYRRDQLERLMR